MKERAKSPEVKYSRVQIEDLERLYGNHRRNPQPGATLSEVMFSSGVVELLNYIASKEGVSTLGGLRDR